MTRARWLEPDRVRLIQQPQRLVTCELHMRDADWKQAKEWPLVATHCAYETSSINLCLCFRHLRLRLRHRLRFLLRFRLRSATLSRQSLVVNTYNSCIQQVRAT